MDFLVGERVVRRTILAVILVAVAFVLGFLSAGCGGGLPASPPPTQVTAAIDPLDGLAPVTVPVPAGALSVSVWRNSETIVALQLLFVDGGDVPIYDYELSAGEVMMEPVPLASDVGAILVTKEDGPETRVRLIFDVVP